MKQYKFDNIVELFNERCRHNPQALLYSYTNTGLTEDANIFSYYQIKNKILSTSSLIQQYTKPGDRVLIIFSPGLDYIITFWSCLFTGVIAVPAYPPFDQNTAEKLQSIIENANPKLIVSNDEIINSIRRLAILKKLSSNKVFKMLTKGFSKKTTDLFEWDFDKFYWLNISREDSIFTKNYQPVHIEPDDIAYLQYTSGSTGMPKGVKVSHRNVLANLELVFDTIGKTEHERMVSWLPPYHDMGLVGNILFPVYAQFPILMMSPVTFLRHPYLWLKAISDFKGTISGGPNFAYELCEKRISLEHVDSNFNLDSWRIAYNGAEHIHHTTLDNFHKKFNKYGFQKKAFYPIYGLAESTVFVSGFKDKNEPPCYLRIEQEALNKNKVLLSNKKNGNTKVIVSCGRPMTELLIVSEKSQQQCLEGEIGEIWLAGSSVTLGYWQREQETIDTFGANINDLKDKSYLKTGDLGFILNNNLYITGRIKDLIIINGKNHYPQDIELIINSCDIRIRPGCTTAFSISENGQEKLAVVAELKKTFGKNEYIDILTKIKLHIHLNYGLSVHLVVLVPPKSVPKTTSGKLRRRHTKKLIEENQLTFLYKWQSDIGA